MTEFVRVKDAVTGHQPVVSRAYAESDPKRFQVIDGPAVNNNGLPLAAKHHKTVATAPAEKKETSK